uniref:Uncharacterized protein n=1 Tax=Lotus japonicus TaxID=34305 RepID=I3T4S9_LOTJA|nr:unknown [Lotus japonicus]
MASSSIEALSVLLEFGIKFCKAFIFSLILLLLLFSDKLWNSAALLLFDEEERGRGTEFDGNSEASATFSIEVKFWCCLKEVIS